MKSSCSIIVIFLLTFSCFAALGQDTAPNRPIEITGRILEKGTKKPVPYVHVVNKTSGKGTVSNTEGRFSIYMHETDTLLFSSIGFETYAFTFSEQISPERLMVTIELNPATMELQPVNIFAFKDEYALKRALLNMDLPLDENETFHSGWTKKNDTQSTGGISLGSPISAIYNTFSRAGRAKRKLEKYQEDYNYQKSIRARYNEQIVKDLTGLPENKVVEFMNFCKLEDTFIERSSTYDIAVAVNRCMSEFIKLDSLSTR